MRYKLSLRDVAEMFLERGFTFTHEAIRDWETRFASLIADQLRTKRRGQAGTSWYVDETYIKVHGKWCYLYRAIDHDGNLVDSMLSEKRNKAFYFCAEYRVAGPNPREPSFEAKFARMQYAGNRRFHLSFLRHTGQWIHLYTDLTVDECIETIRDDPYFSP